MVAKISIFFFPGNHEKAAMRTEIKKFSHLESLFLIFFKNAWIRKVIQVTELLIIEGEKSHFRKTAENLWI